MHMTEAQAERLRQDLRQALASNRPPQILGLTLRTRIHWWLAHRVDHAAIWLTGHGCHQAAMLLWRVTGQR
jgi:hypothetical protein